MSDKQYMPNPALVGPEDLPFYFDYPSSPKIHVCLDQLQECHLPALHRMWQHVTTDGDGFGQGEDFSQIEEKIMRGADPLFLGFVLTDTTNSEVIGVQYIYPSPLSRSEKPLFSGGFRIINKAYRGKGISVLLNKVLLDIVSAKYLGVLARIVVTGHNIVPEIKSGAIFIGSIPWCTNLSNQGWFHDNITCTIFENARSTTKEKGNARGYTIPMLGNKAVLEAALPMFGRCRPIISLPVFYHHSLGRIKVSAASTSDIWQVQEIIRDNALKGDGFGVDEFTASGVFNEKFIRNCMYWVAKQESNEVVVAVILTGDAGLTRSPHCMQATGAIIVLKPYRQQGLGHNLMQFCETQAQMIGYQYVLTDVLACNIAGLGLMRKNGFLITGTLPKSCYVSGYGYSDTFVHWKKIQQRVSYSNL